MSGTASLIKVKWRLPTGRPRGFETADVRLLPAGADLYGATTPVSTTNVSSRLGPHGVGVPALIFDMYQRPTIISFIASTGRLNHKCPV